MGKSFVLSLFRELGSFTIESDRIVDSILREPGVAGSLAGLLGTGVLNHSGVLDKKAVAERIFNDPESRKAVEALLHPLVFERVDALLESIRDGDRIVIVEVPLLFEGNYRKRFSKVITVYTTEEAAITRLEATGIPRHEILLRLGSQIPIGRKKELADYIIDNNGTRDETRKRVSEVYAALLEDKRKQH